jgi:16S rRNA (cytosine967-C5)-methyltransferase
MPEPQVSEAAGVPARRAALRLLDAVLRRGQPLEAALTGATRELREPADRALAHNLAAAVLRRVPDLDRLIDSATQRPLPGDAKARTALRIALAQALVLRTPPHAAIATVLPLVDGGPRKLVHGVFGTLMRRGAGLPELPALPEPVAQRWAAQWGEPTVAAAAAAIAAPPPLDLTLADPAATATWAERLHADSFAPGHLRLRGRAQVTELPGYAEGAWWVQDVAASVPARLIGTGPGRALDLCAAPGGKTLQLAAAGWDVTAVDLQASRLARLRENLERTRLSAQIVQADVLRWQSEGGYDAVLVDAPCSATGIFRRHPDVLHRVHDAFVAEMAEVQARQLARAAGWVRPGGVLVYATCSLERQEGEDRLGRFLADHPGFAPDPADAGLAEGAAVRLLPGRFPGGNDGFFVARLRRNA